MSTSETLGVGSEIAGYRVTGLLGRGGMGFVYEAEHAILGRKAAIKTLSGDLGGDGDFHERFIQESQMVAALDHPSIIPIYDAGEERGDRLHRDAPRRRRRPPGPDRSRGSSSSTVRSRSSSRWRERSTRRTRATSSIAT